MTTSKEMIASALKSPETLKEQLSTIWERKLNEKIEEKKKEVAKTLFKDKEK